MSIAGDAIDKFLVAGLIVEEQSQPGTVADSSFMYENVDKYDGEVQYRVTNPQGSTLYVVSPEDDELYLVHQSLDLLSKVCLPLDKHLSSVALVLSENWTNDH